MKIFTFSYMQNGRRVTSTVTALTINLALTAIAVRIPPNSPSFIIEEGRS